MKVKMSRSMVLPADLANNTVTTQNSIVGDASSKFDTLGEIETMLLASRNSNLVDKGAITEGKYISSSDGKYRDNTTFASTDYINVSNIKALLLTKGTGQFAYYDASKNFLSGITISSAEHENYVFIVPKDAVYARFSISMNYIVNTTDETYGVYDYHKMREIGQLHNFTITVGTGKGEIPRLRDAIDLAIQNKSSKVFVKPGTYNLLDEFSEELSSTLKAQTGIKLENDVHVIFAAGAKVSALYKGTDTSINTYFSPFYSGSNGGFILENVVIESSGTRYCVHDENGSNTGHRVKKYIGCQMLHDDTEAAVKIYPQCIGGGLGQHEDITIEKCYFKSKRSETQDVQASLISYHNSATFSDAESTIKIMDCYLADKGNIRLTHYGPSSKVSKMFACGCSFGYDPIVKHETSNTSTPVNTELIEWNNITRISE